MNWPTVLRLLLGALIGAYLMYLVLQGDLEELDRTRETIRELRERYQVGTDYREVNRAIANEPPANETAGSSESESEFFGSEPVFEETPCKEPEVLRKTTSDSESPAEALYNKELSRKDSPSSFEEKDLNEKVKNIQKDRPRRNTTKW